MSLSAGRTKLHNTMKVLVLRWQAVREAWNDPVSQDFEAAFWAPLESEVPLALRAIDRLDQILHRLKQECG
jgi:hypothetical protein